MKYINTKYLVQQKSCLDGKNKLEKLSSQHMDQNYILIEIFLKHFKTTPL